MADAQKDEAEKNVSSHFAQFNGAPPFAPRSKTVCSVQARLTDAFVAIQIEIWKVKKLIKRLEAARGNGTSMISLIIRTSFRRDAAAATPFD